MNTHVKNFIETNYTLLETDPVEFFHSAYNGLTSNDQSDLVMTLDAADIDTFSARESVLRFIITMSTEQFLKEITLYYFVNLIVGAPILGFTSKFIHDYIIDNIKEFDANVIFKNNQWYISPSA